MGGVDADFLPSLKVESVPSLGRHRERLVDNLYFENQQKVNKARCAEQETTAAHSGKE